MDPEELEVLIDKLQIAARTSYEQRIPFRNIHSVHHRRVIDGAIKNVLSTELAQFTYAQILDGLPTGDVSWDRRYCGVFGAHPIDSEHEELCPGALEKAQEFYQNWDPELLMFDPKVRIVHCLIITLQY